MRPTVHGTDPAALPPASRQMFIHRSLPGRIPPPGRGNLKIVPTHMLEPLDHSWTQSSKAQNHTGQAQHIYRDNLLSDLENVSRHHSPFERSKGWPVASLADQRLTPSVARAAPPSVIGCDMGRASVTQTKATTRAGTERLATSSGPGNLSCNQQQTCLRIH